MVIWHTFSFSLRVFTSILGSVGLAALFIHSPPRDLQRNAEYDDFVQVTLGKSFYETAKCKKSSHFAWDQNWVQVSDTKIIIPNPEFGQRLRERNIPLYQGHR